MGSIEAVDPSPLAEPLHFEFAGVSAPNRFLKAAMTERLCTWSATDLPARGIPTKEFINVYRRWGEGGAGLILTGNILLEYDNLEALGNPIIPLDAPFEGRRFEAFQEAAAVTKKHGSLVIGQVNHPGRQVDERIQPHPVSASDVKLEGDFYGMTFAKPRAATKEDIARFVAEWTHAAEFLYKAGFDGIQIHAAHGYLLAQFLSQTTNKRTDEYGDSLANRARIILEIAKSIREKVPASTGFILGTKLNSVEFQEEGFSAEDCKVLCSILQDEGQFDFVELSGGTYQDLKFEHIKDSTRKREAFFLDFAEQITPALTKTKAYVTGGFRTVRGMVNALNSVHGVGLGRPVCQEFRLCRDILEGRSTGAVEQALDMNDFGITNLIAGAQMRQVGNDHEPIDMTKPENVEAFQKDVVVWLQMMAEDRWNMEKYGCVEIKSVLPLPYYAGPDVKL
ncbi:hypothetical protein LTR67_010223 [Exophiala xenobiotica]